MSYGIIHFFPGGTKEQYDAVLQAVHPGEFELPEGQLFHAAGPSEGGWTVMAIHDSEQSWVKFRDETLTPLMQRGIDGGFTAPPTETGFEVYKQVPSRPTAPIVRPGPAQWGRLPADARLMSRRPPSREQSRASAGV